VLANLKAKVAGGSLKLYFLDECGFSSTMPTGSSWAPPGERRLVEYEAPQGRRVDAMAAYPSYDRSPRLEVFTAERTWKSIL
jgi:putative transposase